MFFEKTFYDIPLTIVPALKIVTATSLALNGLAQL